MGPLANGYGATGKFQQTARRTTMNGKCWLTVSGAVSEGMNMKQFTPCYLPTLGWTRESL